jgi:hypothetical protein
MVVDDFRLTITPKNTIDSSISIKTTNIGQINTTKDKTLELTRQLYLTLANLK